MPKPDWPEDEDGIKTVGSVVRFQEPKPEDYTTLADFKKAQQEWLDFSTLPIFWGIRD